MVATMSAAGRGGSGWSGPSRPDRAEWLAHLGDTETHRHLLRETPCFHVINGQAPPVTARALAGWVRIGAWNVERGRRPDRLAALMQSCAVDVWLLSELDSGMARSGNVDVTARLASALAAGYAYGVEFVELGAGDGEERASIDEEDRQGLHGNALLSATAIVDAEVVRLDDDGAWFGRDSDQPRVGSRMAVLGAVDVDGARVVMASTHLESQSDSNRRADQLGCLLDRLDDRYPGEPAVVGGDLNTFGAGVAELASRSSVTEMRAKEPARFSWPVPHESLFDVAAAHGFEWVDANVAGPTTRHSAGGLPDHVPLRLDWILVRGLEARRPAIVPAVGPDGRALSDHDIVAVSVRRPR